MLRSGIGLPAARCGSQSRLSCWSSHRAVLRQQGVSRSYQAHSVPYKAADFARPQRPAESGASPRPTLPPISPPSLHGQFQKCTSVESLREIFDYHSHQLDAISIAVAFKRLKELIPVSALLSPLRPARSASCTVAATIQHQNSGGAPSGMSEPEALAMLLLEALDANSGLLLHSANTRTLCECLRSVAHLYSRGICGYQLSRHGLELLLPRLEEEVERALEELPADGEDYAAADSDTTMHPAGLHPLDVSSIIFGVGSLQSALQPKDSLKTRSLELLDRLEDHAAQLVALYRDKSHAKRWLLPPSVLTEMAAGYAFSGLAHRHSQMFEDAAQLFVQALRQPRGPGSPLIPVEQVERMVMACAHAKLCHEEMIEAASTYLRDGITAVSSPAAERRRVNFTSPAQLLQRFSFLTGTVRRLCGVSDQSQAMMQALADSVSGISAEELADVDSKSLSYTMAAFHGAKFYDRAAVSTVLQEASRRQLRSFSPRSVATVCFSAARLNHCISSDWAQLAAALHSELVGTAASLMVHFNDQDVCNALYSVGWARGTVLNVPTGGGDEDHAASAAAAAAVTGSTDEAMAAAPAAAANTHHSLLLSEAQRQCEQLIDVLVRFASSTMPRSCSWSLDDSDNAAATAATNGDSRAMLTHKAAEYNYKSHAAGLTQMLYAAHFVPQLLCSSSEPPHGAAAAILAASLVQKPVKTPLQRYPNLYDAAADALQMSPLRTSRSAREVAALLLLLLQEYGLDSRLEVRLEEPIGSSRLYAACLYADVVVVDRQFAPPAAEQRRLPASQSDTPPASSTAAVASAPSGRQSYAERLVLVLEVDGPHHYAQNNKEHPLGRTVLRDRLLQASLRRDHHSNGTHNSPLPMLHSLNIETDCGLVDDRSSSHRFDDLLMGKVTADDLSVEQQRRLAVVRNLLERALKHYYGLQ